MYVYIIENHVFQQTNLTSNQIKVLRLTWIRSFEIWTTIVKIGATFNMWKAEINSTALCKRALNY